ncbi:MAG: hypothetical protein WC565_01560 [Parcubacteria group bacterium]
MKAKNKTNEKRRKFLKLLAFGGIALVAAKLFGNKLTALAAPVSALPKKKESQKTFGDKVNMIEDDKQVAFIDKRTGEEIFILEKD